MGFEIKAYDPEGVWKDIVADNIVEASELGDFENKINQDGKVSRSEIDAFSELLKHSVNKNGQTIFTSEALLYTSTHFAALKEKAQKEHEITSWLIGGGSALGVAGLVGCRIFPASIIPGIVVIVGLAAIIAGAIVMSDGSTTVAKHFDDSGTLVSP